MRIHILFCIFKYIYIYILCVYVYIYIYILCIYIIYIYIMFVYYVYIVCVYILCIYVYIMYILCIIYIYIYIYIIIYIYIALIPNRKASRILSKPSPIKNQKYGFFGGTMDDPEILTCLCRALSLRASASPCCPTRPYSPRITDPTRFAAHKKHT